MSLGSFSAVIIPRPLQTREDVDCCSFHNPLNTVFHANAIACKAGMNGEAVAGEAVRILDLPHIFCKSFFLWQAFVHGDRADVNQGALCFIARVCSDCSHCLTPCFPKPRSPVMYSERLRRVNRFSSLSRMKNAKYDTPIAFAIFFIIRLSSGRRTQSPKTGMPFETPW